MDDKGNIYDHPGILRLEAQADAGNVAAKKAVKSLVGLDATDIAHVADMNRAQRRAWYSDRRRALKKAAKKAAKTAAKTEDR